MCHKKIDMKMLEDHRKFHFNLKNPKFITQGALATQDTVSRWYMMYKLSLGVYFLSTFGVYSYLHGFVKNDIGLTMIYLTHWCHKLLTVSFTFNTALVVIRFIQENRKKRTEDTFFEENCFTLKLSWIMSSAANNLAIAVTIVYWGALFDPKEERATLEEFENYDVHLIQTVITLMDVVISARPWRLFHAIYPFIYALTYLGFNVIYTVVLGGKNAKGEDFVYPILDWRNVPITAGLWVVVFIILIFMSQIFLCTFAYIRDKVFEYWMKKFRYDIEMENIA